MGDNLHSPTIVYIYIYYLTQRIIYYIGEFNLPKNESKFQVVCTTVKISIYIMVELNLLKLEGTYYIYMYIQCR